MSCGCHCKCSDSVKGSSTTPHMLKIEERLARKNKRCAKRKLSLPAKKGLVELGPCDVPCRTLKPVVVSFGKCVCKH